MSQRRIQDYGSPVIAKNLKELILSFTRSSVLSGNEFLVDSPDRMRINPGVAVTHQGVIIIEDEPKYLNVPNTSSAVDYTVYYSHSDSSVSGGISADLVIDTGILTEDVVEGVILGYVRYPGGGVPLSAAYFISPYNKQLGTIDPSKEISNWLVPVNSNQYLITFSSGGTLDLTNTWDTSGSKPEMYLKVRNNALATGTVTLTFPFKVNNRAFSLLQLFAAADINATITPYFIDSEGTTHTLVVAPITGATTLTLYSYTIPRVSVQNANTLVYLQVIVQCAVGREVKLQAVGLNDYNLPV